MAVAREASDSHLVRATGRMPAKEGARRARKSVDKRKRENKGGGSEPVCRATADKAIGEGRRRAKSLFKEGDRTIDTFLARMASGGD